MGASRGGLAFLLTLKHLCSGADHQCPPYESTCVHMASELKGNERLYPPQKGEDPCLKLPCVKILFLTSHQYPVRGNHVVTTRKGILMSIFATPVSSQLCLRSPAAASPPPHMLTPYPLGTHLISPLWGLPRLPKACSPGCLPSVVTPTRWLAVAHLSRPTADSLKAREAQHQGTAAGLQT